MSKRSRRKERARQARAREARAAIPPISLLRPRLDELLGRQELAGWGVQRLEAELDAAMAGLNIGEALPVLVRAYHQAPEPVRRRLDEALPRWLAERGYAGTLLSLLERGGIYAEGWPAAAAWLERAGVERAALEQTGQQQPAFYRAYAYDDGSQGTVFVLWYADHRRQRVRGMSFLIDHNPPWEGAVKDIMVLPKRTPEEIAERFVHGWARRGLPLGEVDAAEAKTRILRGLEANRCEGIRLPRDLVGERRAFLEHVLTLPDGPYTLQFTAQDFDELARTGQSPEQLSLFEQQVGRLVRLEDGTEVLVLDLEDWE